LAGRADAAEAALHASCETCIEFNESALLASRAAELADTLCDQSRTEEAQSWIDISRERAAPEDRDAQSSWRSVAARVAAKQGDLALAEKLGREALAIVEATDALNHHAKVLLDLAEVLFKADRHDEGVQLVQRAVYLYEVKGNVAAKNLARTRLPGVTVAK
jgi:tetratricopeptide (TPR) repeat protein